MVNNLLVHFYFSNFWVFHSTLVITCAFTFLGKLYCKFFSKNLQNKPFIKVRNLENDPPHLGTFPKRSSDLVAPHYPKFEKFSHDSLSPLKMAVLKQESQKCHKVQTRKDTYSELKLSTSTWMVFFRITNFFHIIFIFK